MVIFNPTRKLKSSDGLMVLFQLFLILEVGYFLSRTVNRLIIFIPWLRWLRSATYHYVDNGFLRQTSLKWSKVDLNDSVPWKSSSPLQASFKVCYASLTCPKRGCVGQRSLQMLILIMGITINAVSRSKRFIIGSFKGWASGNRKFCTYLIYLQVTFIGFDLTLVKIHSRYLEPLLTRTYR